MGFNSGFKGLIFPEIQVQAWAVLAMKVRLYAVGGESSKTAHTTTNTTTTTTTTTNHHNYHR